MKDRIIKFLTAENISKAEFAQTLGIGKPNVSHFTSGRSKPSCDVLAKIIEHYPSLNLQWLITGKGKMYYDEAKSPGASPETSSGSESPANSPQNRPSANPRTDGQTGSLFPEEQQAPAISPQRQPQELPGTSNGLPQQRIESPERRITRIIVFYDDNTFQEMK